VKAWLDDDTTAVLRSFHPHAVLFPPGSAPVEGLAAIRSYWWPTDGSHTRITSFTRTVAEIEGTPGLAYLRGSASLGWVYRTEDKETAQTSRSIDLVVLAPDSSGRWRIIRQMWSQLPP
jgi:ketosteroid isomerase-like protein